MYICFVCVPRFPSLDAPGKRRLVHPKPFEGNQMRDAGKWGRPGHLGIHGCQRVVARPQVLR